jgi:hypothetical protein
MTLAGLAAHELGGAVVPAVQLNATVLAYPFPAANLPLNVAVCVGNIVNVGFVMLIA